MRRVAGIISLLVILLVVVGGYRPLAALSAGENRLYLPLMMGGSATNDGADREVTAATYLGATGEDRATAVEVAPDGSVVVAGVMPGHNPGGQTPTALLGGGDGVVVRLDSTGKAVRSVTRIGASVNDLEINAAGSIVICGDFGVAVLHADASAVIWSATPGAGSRCAIGSDGTVAVLVGGKAYVYTTTGTPVQNWDIGGSNQADIAVDGVNNSVIATGYTQVSSNLQIAFMRAWAYDGMLKWKSYDFADAPGLGSDTRGERIAIGQDGKLYFAGSINGGTGASIFARDPKDITITPGSDRVITIDTYAQATNVGSVKMTWYGRYNPVDGALITGQSLLTRLSSGKGNSIVVKGITADATGRVYLAGEAACCIKERDNQRVAGVTVGSYESGEAFFMVVTADFKERLVWTPFAAPNSSAGGSPATGVGVRNGVAALVISLSPRQDGTARDLITYNALQETRSTLPDAYVAVWSFK